MDNIHGIYVVNSDDPSHTSHYPEFFLGISNKKWSWSIWKLVSNRDETFHTLFGWYILCWVNRLTWWSSALQAGPHQSGNNTNPIFLVKSVVELPPLRWEQSTSVSLGCRSQQSTPVWAIYSGRIGSAFTYNGDK